MAGFQALFVAQMLQPVNELSDDDAPAETPMAKPASNRKLQPTPKSSPKTPKGKSVASPKTPKSKSVASPKTTAGSSSRPSALKRPAAALSTIPEDREVPEDPEEDKPLKKPAAKSTRKEPQVLKCFYKNTGQWGIKFGGKQLMSVPGMHLIIRSRKSLNHHTPSYSIYHFLILGKYLAWHATGKGSRDRGLSELFSKQSFQTPCD